MSALRKLMPSNIKKPCVVLGVTGGIAVYKACELLRLLQKRGIDVFGGHDAERMPFCCAADI